VAQKVSRRISSAPRSLVSHSYKAPQSNYTNSTHVLSRVRVDQISGSLSLLACCDGLVEEEVGFTVTVYSECSISLSWDTEIPPPRYTHKVYTSTLLLFSIFFGGRGNSH
jgi:calpain-7